MESLVIWGTYALIARITKGLKVDDDLEIPGLEEMLRRGSSDGC